MKGHTEPCECDIGNYPTVLITTGGRWSEFFRCLWRLFLTIFNHIDRFILLFVPYILVFHATISQVFPVIRRRFRNEQERRSGLEQIKGALLLGMTEIACQTVDFLYEDNGGRPKDLVLPTLDDIKEDLAKFTIGLWPIIEWSMVIWLRLYDALKQQASWLSEDWEILVDKFAVWRTLLCNTKRFQIMDIRN